MNIKQIIKSILIFIAIFFVGFILHTSVFSHFILGVVTPNILLMITASIGFMHSSNAGMVMGFFSGLMMDCYYPEYFGLYCLIYLVIGYLNGLFARFFYGDDIRLPMLLMFLSDILYGMVIYIFLFFSRGRMDMGFYLTNIIIPEAVYTLVIFLLLYYPLLLVIRWAGSKNGRGHGFV